MSPITSNDNQFFKNNDHNNNNNNNNRTMMRIEPETPSSRIAPIMKKKIKPKYKFKLQHKTLLLFIFASIYCGNLLDLFNIRTKYVPSSSFTSMIMVHGMMIVNTNLPSRSGKPSKPPSTLGNQYRGRYNQQRNQFGSNFQQRFNGQSTSSGSTSTITAATNGISANAADGVSTSDFIDYSNDQINDERKLFNYLMRNYDNTIRPVKNASKPINIRLGITLTQIFDLDEKNQVLTTNVWLDQEWIDEFLTWNSSDFGNITKIRIPCQSIWLPDIVLYNNADDYTRGYMNSRAIIEPNGNVFWPPPTKFRSTCQVDVTYFPFDDQSCIMKLGSWIYDGLSVNIENRTQNVDLSNYVSNGEWDLLRTSLVRNVVYYPCCFEPFPDVTITLVIRRKILYYMYNVIIPCIMMSLLTLLVFCLPPESGEKIALGVTVLLAFSVFMLAISEKLPETSESIPLLGVYLTVVMGITSVSIVMTVVVLNFHYCSPLNKRELPEWIKLWIIGDQTTIFDDYYQARPNMSNGVGCCPRRSKSDEKMSKQSMPNHVSNGGDIMVKSFGLKQQIYPQCLSPSDLFQTIDAEIYSTTQSNDGFFSNQNNNNYDGNKAASNGADTTTETTTNASSTLLSNNNNDNNNNDNKVLDNQNSTMWNHQHQQQQQQHRAKLLDPYHYPGNIQMKHAHFQQTKAFNVCPNSMKHNHHHHHQHHHHNHNHYHHSQQHTSSALQDHNDVNDDLITKFTTRVPSISGYMDQKDSTTNMQGHYNPSIGNIGDSNRRLLSTIAPIICASGAAEASAFLGTNSMRQMAPDSPLSRNIKRRRRKDNHHLLSQDSTGTPPPPPPFSRQDEPWCRSNNDGDGEEEQKEAEEEHDDRMGQTNGDEAQPNQEMLQMLRYLMYRQEVDDNITRRIHEWRLLSMFIDKILFWIFTITTVLTSVTFLVIIPVNRRGF